MAFHWLTVSLAVLLPGQQKIFLPPPGSYKIESLPAEDARYVSPCSGLY